MPPAAEDHADDLTYDTLVWRRNFFGALAAVLLALVVVTGVLDEVTSAHEERSFAVGASPRLVVHDRVSGGWRGGITVRAGGGDRIDVEGKVHGTWRVRYVLEQRGDDVVIDVQPRTVLGWLGFLGPARFTLTAPPATRLDVETSGAAIEVQQITGGGVLRTTNGSIRLDSVAGPLTAVSTNGAITATGFEGTAELRTVNGCVDVQGSRGVFDVSTTNGSVMLDAELRAGAHHRATTTNGAVTVRLRGEPSLRVEAHTTNGAVVARRSIAATERSDHALAGTIGGGEGELVVRTTNGGIVIE